MSAEMCNACFKPLVTEPVRVRYGSRYDGAQWVDSGIVRCANPECHNTTGGTLVERLTYISNVYGYKYFGDYELTAEQSDAVREARAIAETAPDLQATIEGLRGEIETLQDKVEGLTCDLRMAVETAYHRGATEWTRLNYPHIYAALNPQEARHD